MSAAKFELNSFEMEEELSYQYSSLSQNEALPSQSQTLLKSVVRDVIPAAMAKANVKMAPNVVEFLLDFGITEAYAEELREAGKHNLVETLSDDLSKIFEIVSFHGIVTKKMLQRTAKSNKCPRPYTGWCR